MNHLLHKKPFVASCLNLAVLKHPKCLMFHCEAFTRRRLYAAVRRHYFQPLFPRLKQKDSSLLWCGDGMTGAAKQAGFCCQHVLRFGKCACFASICLRSTLESLFAVLKYETICSIWKYQQARIGINISAVYSVKSLQRWRCYIFFYSFCQIYDISFSQNVSCAFHGFMTLGSVPI